MKLEVGEFYLAEDGRVIKIVENQEKDLYLGYFDTAIEAARTYDQYIVDNNLEHTKNF